jgi:UDP-glucose 4-epimerase
MNVLVTGGAGYIGSHAVQRLLRDGDTVVVVDNLLRGHVRALDLLRSGANGKRLVYVQTDIANRPTVESLLREHRVEVVIHFAALAYVGESVEHPLLYYRNNVTGMIALLEACDAAGVERFVFSSSCSVYGQPPDEMIPTPEECPRLPVSPYGMTKLHGEHVLAHYAEACRTQKKPFAFAALRYFNVAGADRSGVLGEDHEPETHLIPVVLHAALGRRKNIGIFGTDYPTPDGTCVRDYLHIEDLIDAHVVVTHALKPGDAKTYNLGIGKGYTVREIIDAAVRVTGRRFEVVEEKRRPGDPPRLFADPTKIQRELKWQASVSDLHGIIETAYKWLQAHPRGYRL